MLISHTGEFERQEHRRRSAESGLAAAGTALAGSGPGADPLQDRVALVKSWQRVSSTRRLKRLPKTLDAMWDAGSAWLRLKLPQTGRLLRRAAAIDRRVEAMTGLPEAELAERTERLRETFRRGRDRRAEVDEGMAVVACWLQRRLGMRPYRVQIAGALGLYEGRLVEMATGEGKTITAALPAVLWAWRGRGCHVLTANDYLAQRDADELRPLYHACRLRVAHVSGSMEPAQRRAAYAADLTYCTSKEAAADWLRDQIRLGRGGSFSHQLLEGLMQTGSAGAGRGQRLGDTLVMRDLAFALVDEADSLLIDEAVTPLIISTAGRDDERARAYRRADALVPRLREGRDYAVDHSFREVRLTDAGRRRLAELTAPDNAAVPAGDITTDPPPPTSEDRGDSRLWRSPRVREELIHQALTAHHLYERDHHYVVAPKPDDPGRAPSGHDEEPELRVMIVDTNTGRLMPDRKWRGGLHQAVEAKEGVAITPADETLARISFQRFFRLYRRLAGMSGTVWENRHEMLRVYRVPTARIPTHRPCIRRHLRERYFARSGPMWEAVVRHLREVHGSGRPVLVGTRTVGESEELSRRLKAIGLAHVVLNAVHHAHEAEIVKLAGQPGRITVATNMAGRGTDIKLGRGVNRAGGLHVIAIGRNEARRIDRQLYGRAGRQGDPGSAATFIAMDDILMSRYGLPWLRWWPRLAVHAAQWRAERRAGAFRRMLVKQDEQLRDQLGFAGVED